jgi:hypothetical protein
MLTVVWNPIGFHVLRALPKARKFNTQYYTNDILVAISDWRRQTGEHGRTSCGCILIMFGHTPRKCQGITSVSIEWNRHFIQLFARFGTLGLFPFLLRQRKVNGISRWNSIWTSCPYSGYFGEIPRETLNAVFLEWMERLQKCVQVDGEYVGWAKRTQYVEIDCNREIRKCYTWHGTPYT